MSRGENRYIGRQLYSTFSEAGLNSVSIYPIPMYSTIHTPEELKMLVQVPLQIIQADVDAMVREGMTTKKDYDDTIKEILQVLSHPGAFAMGLFILVVGKIP